MCHLKLVKWWFNLSNIKKSEGFKINAFKKKERFSTFLIVNRKYKRFPQSSRDRDTTPKKVCLSDSRGTITSHLKSQDLWQFLPERPACKIAPSLNVKPLRPSHNMNILWSGLFAKWRRRLASRIRKKRQGPKTDLLHGLQ